MLHIPIILDIIHCSPELHAATFYQRLDCTITTYCSIVFYQLNNS